VNQGIFGSIYWVNLEEISEESQGNLEESLDVGKSKGIVTAWKSLGNPSLGAGEIWPASVGLALMHIEG
jgi:hypothetical protein